jgi:glycosyltransferase involved in cell wall biosynthesis
MIARLLKDKGVYEYVEAARRVSLACPEARFSLVGWIDSNPSAIRQEDLQAWMAAGDIEFLGKMADVRPAIAHASVYVLPSYREGTPRTVLEAMAMGRPVITTDAPGCRETVLDGENGFLVPVGSVDELAEAMMRFARKPSLFEEMGRRSRDLAVFKYDVRKVNAAIIAAMKLAGSAEDSKV